MTKINNPIVIGGGVNTGEVLKAGNSSYGGSSSGSLVTTKDYKAIVVNCFTLSTRGGSGQNCGSSVKAQDGTTIANTVVTNTNFWGGTPNKGDMDCLNAVWIYLNVPSGSTVTYTATANQRTGSSVMGIL